MASESPLEEKKKSLVPSPLPKMASESIQEEKKKSLTPLNRFPTVTRMQSVDSPVAQITGFTVKQKPDEVGVQEEKQTEIKIEE